MQIGFISYVRVSALPDAVYLLDFLSEYTHHGLLNNVLCRECSFFSERSFCIRMRSLFIREIL